MAPGPAPRRGRGRRRENEALRHRHVEVEEVGHVLLPLDALGDELDAGAGEHRRKVVDLDIEPAQRLGLEQELGGELHEPHAAVGERERIEAQIRRPIEREGKAAVAQLRQRAGLLGVERPPAALRDFEDQAPGHVRIGVEKASELTQEAGLRERGRRDIAGDERVAAARGEVPRDRRRAREHLAVELRHQPTLLEHRQELGRHEERLVGKA